MDETDDHGLALEYWHEVGDYEFRSVWVPREPPEAGEAAFEAWTADGWEARGCEGFIPGCNYFLKRRKRGEQS